MTPEERRAAKRARYAAHREQECKKKREWYAANVAKAREQSRRHKIKKGLQSDRRQAWSRWTPERIAQLRQMRADGITYRECAAALNSSRFACENACERYGIPQRKIRQNAEPVLAKHTARRRESDAQAAMWRQLLGAAV
jgi:DNA invertase Pin-like site-specific DNA recombinase